MSGVATTIRLEEEIRDALRTVSQARRLSMNAIVNVALDRFLKEETAALENDLSEILERVRAYRKFDPDFSIANKAVVKAEAELESDPAEGRIVPPAEGESGLADEVDEILRA